MPLNGTAATFSPRRLHTLRLRTRGRAVSGPAPARPAPTPRSRPPLSLRNPATPPERPRHTQSHALEPADRYSPDMGGLEYAASLKTW